MRSPWFALVLGAVAVVMACGGGSPSPTRVIGPITTTAKSPQITAVSFETGTTPAPQLQVEIANTVDLREVGLMNRSALGADAGMLFVFPSDTSAAFWMKDTLIPLSIAFLQVDGTIVHIEDMRPQTETLHYSTENYRYAIEANVGWFTAQGISAGDKAVIPSGISATS